MCLYLERWGCVLCNNVKFDVITQLSGKIRRVNNYGKNYIVYCTSPAFMKIKMN